MKTLRFTSMPVVRWFTAAFLAGLTGSASASCAWDSSFNPGGGFSSGSTVYAVVTQSDGKVIFGGSFTYYGNYPNGYPFTVNNLVRFNSNGSVDTSYNPAPNSSVLAMVIQPDDKIIIGGSFSQVSGLSQTAISRLTTSGYPDYINFQAAVPNYYVYALALQSDGKVIVGGGFSTMSGAAYSRLARLKTSGGLDSTFNPGVYGPPSSPAVRALAVYPSGTPSAGKILVGGDFTVLGSLSRPKIGRLNSNGTVDTSFDTGSLSLNGPIYAIATAYGPFTTQGANGPNVEKVYIGGGFSAPRTYFARLSVPDGSSTVAIDNNIENQVPNGPVKSIRIESNQGILIGGSFTVVQFATRNGIARFSPPPNDTMSLSDWADCAGATGGSIEAVGLNGNGSVYIGGNFTTFEGTARTNLARLLAP